MQNPFTDIMPDVLNAWRGALRPEGTLPVAVQLQRYVAKHRNNPQEMAQFFQKAVQQGMLKPDHVEAEMERYVKTMEPLARKQDKEIDAETMQEDWA